MTYKDKSYSIVTAVCRLCGKMQFEERYYDERGNAATKFIDCDDCIKKGK